MTIGKTFLIGFLLLVLTFVIAFFQPQTYLALALLLLATSAAAWFLYTPRG
jgi:hypothetical protein